MRQRIKVGMDLSKPSLKIGSCWAILGGRAPKRQVCTYAGLFSDAYTSCAIENIKKSKRCSQSVPSWEKNACFESLAALQSFARFAEFASGKRILQAAFRPKSRLSPAQIGSINSRKKRQNVIKVANRCRFAHHFEGKGSTALHSLLDAALGLSMHCQGLGSRPKPLPYEELNLLYRRRNILFSHYISFAQIVW